MSKSTIPEIRLSNEFTLSVGQAVKIKEDLKQFSVNGEVHDKMVYSLDHTDPLMSALSDKIIAGELKARVCLPEVPIRSDIRPDRLNVYIGQNDVDQWVIQQLRYG